MHILWWAIVGLIAGWATGKIMKGAGYGVLMDIIVGIAGAMLGGFLMRADGFCGRGWTDLHRYCCHRWCCDPHRNLVCLCEANLN